jgi:hypothetical protein
MGLYKLEDVVSELREQLESMSKKLSESSGNTGDVVFATESVEVTLHVVATSDKETMGMNLEVGAPSIFAVGMNLGGEVTSGYTNHTVKLVLTPMYTTGNSSEPYSKTFISRPSDGLD